MKKLLLQIFFITLFIFGLNGCYTIIWSPDSEFPNQDNSEAGAAYYSDYYYGDYYYFYDIPWWYDFIPPATTGSGTTNRDNNPDVGTLRDMSGRSDPSRVPDVQPPSRNDNNSGNNNDNSSSSSNNTSSNNSDRGSSSSNSGNSGSSGSGSVRDNNGGRSSGGRK